MGMTIELPKKVKFRGSHSSKFTNGYYIAFHDRMYDFIGGIDRARLHISDEVMAEWRRLIDMAMITGPKTSTVMLTQKLGTLDAQRVELVTYIFNVIRTQCGSRSLEIRDSAERLKVIVRRFRGLQARGREHKSSMICSMVSAFREKEADLKRLGIKVAVDDLEKVSREYDAAWLQRADARKLYTATYKVRPMMDEVYAFVLNKIAAAHTFAETEAERQSIEALMDEINQLVGDFRRSYNESIAQKRRARKKAESDADELDSDSTSLASSDVDSSENDSESDSLASGELNASAQMVDSSSSKLVAKGAEVSPSDGGYYDRPRERISPGDELYDESVEEMTSYGEGRDGPDATGGIP